MASSGTFTKTIRTGYQLKLVWEETSQSVANNTSTISVKVQLVSTGSSYTINSSATKNGTLKVNGTSYSFTFSAALSGNQTKTIYSKSVIVSHNADGTKSCAFEANAGINVTLSGTYYGTITVSGTGTFDTIPRASKFTFTVQASQKMYIGSSNVVIMIDPASNAFKHTLKYKFGNQSGTIASNVGASCNWSVPASLANAIPNNTSGTGTITCETYNGSTLIGTTSVSFTAYVPDSVVPTISNVDVGDTQHEIASKFNGFVQHKSKLEVQITASGAYSSTIKNYETYIEGVAYNGQTFTSNIIKSSGTISVKTIVTDSRGRTKTSTKNISVLAYSLPKITTFNAFRCDANGNEDPDGERLFVELNFSIATVNNLNDKYYEVVYREKGTSSWNVLVSGNIYSRNDSFITSNVFDPDLAYDLGLNLYDFFSEDHAYLDIPTAFTILDFNESGKGLAIGKVSQSDNLEIAMDVDLTGELLQENRIAATLQNGWVNYGGGYEEACFWKDKNNVVHISGFIKSGATAGETVLFTLPAGYRPRANEKVVTVSLNAFCVLDIYSSGNVVVKYGANSGWISLCNISFRAD